MPEAAIPDSLLMPPIRVPKTMHVDYQRLLTETAHLLLQDTDADTLCLSIFDLLRQPLELDVYFHFLVSDDRTHLRLASCGGHEEVRAALGVNVDFGQTVCGTVAQNCRWMHVTHVQQRSDEMTQLIRSFGIRCYTCEPLIVKDEIVGTLSFGSCSRDAFSSEEIELFHLLAQQVRVVTERRRQSEHIRQLELLANTGRMCATLAHEINNPLESLVNLMYLLRDEVATDEGRSFVEQAEKQLLRLADTSQRTLDLFRGKRPKPSEVDLGEFALDLLGDISFPAEVRLESHIDDHVVARVIPGELRQVLFNLIRNAIQFTPAGGQVQLDVSRRNGRAEVRVRDQGPGISANLKQNLFKPFFTTRANGGTGLGLWISREMVEHVGGTLTVESDPVARPGSEFIVSLPISA